MTCRIGRIFLLILAVLALAAVPLTSLADGGLGITNVIQNGGELRVYLNVTDSSLRPSGNGIAAKDFVLNAAGTITPASAVTPINQLNVRTEYIYLRDTTTGPSVGGGLSNERTYTGPSDLNTKLQDALYDISKKSDYQSQTVRHAVVVITDKDVSKVNATVLTSIQEKHIPVFVVFLGNVARNLEVYANACGGKLYYSAADTYAADLNRVYDQMNSAVILRFYPEYSVFTAGEVILSVSVSKDGKTTASQGYKMVLTTNNVPPTTPSPTPTETPTPQPETPTPKPPTIPPTKAPTPTPTPSPTPAPTEVPITEIVIPVVTPSPVPTPTPTPVPTVPPTPTPTPVRVTDAPVVTPEPTTKPDGFDLMKWINTDDNIWLVGAGVLFILAVIILLVVFRKKKNPPFDPGSQISINSEEEGPATTYGNHGEGDGQETTYGNSSASGSGGRPDMGSGKTTGPFDSTRQSLFGDAGDNGDDMNKTISISSFGADPDKTVRIQDNSGLRIKFTVDTNGNINTYMAAVRNKIVVGRGKDCDVIINDSSVSKQHIEITYESDGLYVRDLNSSNGTRLNGDPVNSSKPMPLRTNDILVLGFSKVTVEVLA